jgi:hypothetical protein
MLIGIYHHFLQYLKLYLDYRIYWGGGGGAWTDITDLSIWSHTVPTSVVLGIWSQVTDTLSHNVVSTSPHHEQGSNSQL